MKVRAVIASIQQATPSVKRLFLAVTNPLFSFLPGQWVDFFAGIDGREEVAGYSITSSPLLRGAIELAVKNEGEKKVTRYLHERARVGDRVAIAVGGDFFYTSDLGQSLVLIAGGIGINPMMSILRYLDDAAPQVQATLLYSARTSTELLFGDDIRRIEARNVHFDAHFTVTRCAQWQGLRGRIDAATIKKLALRPGALYYLCGPPAMVANLRRDLHELGIHPARIKYESWYGP